ncbi:hypothetical protein ACRB68_35620 [Actinomadura sp. RB68]|uniref:Uncharacterized protein n=1 Tax=Actinomadura macrotermitis TaxID=2585200 RepID=A0A7K0BWN0_9ACTN|nr:hypothetical protein [Actinomadura macrotermitis]
MIHPEFSQAIAKDRVKELRAQAKADRRAAQARKR